MAIELIQYFPCIDELLDLVKLVFERIDLIDLQLFLWRYFLDPTLFELIVV